MDDLRISLSDAEHSFLDEQAASLGHATSEDYATAVIRAELKAKAQERLEAQLLEALDEDAPDEEWTDSDWETLRARAAGR